MSAKPLPIQFKRFLSVLLCMAMALLILLPQTALAAEERTVVRVGWYESPFHTTDSMGRRSGYAYEYEQKIAAYNGWAYEYVEGSWPELLEMLKCGQIDLLAEVSYTEERAEQMLFASLPMGEEEYYAYISKDNTGISPENISTLNGSKIAVNKGSIQAQMTAEWVKKRGINAQIIEVTDGEKELNEKLKSGQIDVWVTVDSNSGSYDLVPVCKVGGSSYYFAVNPDRPDLLRDLDAAMDCIYSENRYYNQQLFQRFFASEGANVYLGTAEADWLRAHGPIRVGYRENYYPFCGTDPDTGEPSGILRDYLEMASGTMLNGRLCIEYVPYKNMQNAMADLSRGELDCVFPVNLSTYAAEQKGILLTNSILDTEMSALVPKSRIAEFSLEGEVKVAVNAGNVGYEEFLKNNFPSWEIVYFDSTEECFKGISQGKADCIVVSSHRLASVSRLTERYKMTAIATGRTNSLMLAVNPDHVCLYAILNRIRNNIPDASVANLVVTNTVFDTRASFAEFIRDNLAAVLGIVTALTALFVLLWTRYAKVRITEKNTRRANEEITSLNAELERAKTIAESANSAKTMFLNNMSHDIRTPLNAILGFARLLRKEKVHTAVVDDYLDKIEESGVYLLSIINNVLDMARIDSGEMRLDESVMDMETGSRIIADLFAADLDRKNLTFTQSVDIQHRYVLADRSRIGQIAVNLISNAVKYTPDSGRIHLDVREIPCDREGYASYQVTLSDNGIGMSQEFQKHLFEPFSRERNTTESKVIGTGLGMSIVKKLVDLLGGTICVESEVGKGTTFTLTYTHRIAEEPRLPEREKTAAAADFSLRGRRILLAEDNDLNAEIAVAILEDMGFATERAEDGVVCIDLLRKAAPGYYDLILMDIQMPNLDGYMTTQRIRRLDDPVKRGIPIVAMTANAFDEDRKKALESGMNGHLTKPIEVDRLMETLTEILK